MTLNVMQNFFGGVPSLQPQQANVGGPGLQPMPANGWVDLRKELRTSNWAIIPFYSIFKSRSQYRFSLKPYAYGLRDRIVQDTAEKALYEVYQRQKTIAPTGEMVGTFRRLNEFLGNSKSGGKTIEQCRQELNAIKSEYATLMVQRDDFSKRGNAQKERLPKLTGQKKALAQQAAIEARMSKRVAQAVLLCVTRALRSPGGGVGAKTLIDRAVNSIVADYKNGSAEHAAATRAALAITNLAAGATAIATANAAREQACLENEQSEAVLIERLGYENCPTFKNFAEKRMELDQKLRRVAGEVFESLCLGDKSAYANTRSFTKLYNSVCDGYTQVTEVAKKLDEFGVSVGLPSLLEDRLEASLKHKIKEQAKDALADWPKFTFLVGAESATALFLYSGLSIPSPILAAGVFAGMTAVNLAAISLFNFIWSDDF